MKIFGGIASGVNVAGGGIVKAGVKLTETITSKKIPKTVTYMQEVVNSALTILNIDLATTSYI